MPKGARVVEEDSAYEDDDQGEETGSSSSSSPSGSSSSAASSGEESGANGKEEMLSSENGDDEEDEVSVVDSEDSGESKKSKKERKKWKAEGVVQPRPKKRKTPGRGATQARPITIPDRRVGKTQKKAPVYSNSPLQFAQEIEQQQETSKTPSPMLAAKSPLSNTQTPQKVTCYRCECGKQFPTSQLKAAHCKYCEIYITNKGLTGHVTPKRTTKKTSTRSPSRPRAKSQAKNSSKAVAPLKNSLQTPSEHLDGYKQTPEPTELPPTQTPRTPPTTGVNSQEQGKDDLSNCTLSSNSTENVDKGPLSKETPITDIVDKGPLSTLAISSPQPVADDEMHLARSTQSTSVAVLSPSPQLPADLAEKPKVLNLYPTLCPALGTINVESQGESQEIPPTPTKPTASSVAPSTPSSQSSRNKTTSTPLRSSKKKRPPTTKKGTAPTPHPPAPNHAATSGAIPLLSFASLPLSSLSSISIPSTPSTHSGQSTVSSALASTSTVNVAPSPSPGLPSSGMRAAAVAAAAAIASPNLHAQPHAIFPHMRFTRTQRNRTLERLEAENDPADKEKVDTMVEDSDNIGGSSSEEDETFKLSSSQKASQSKKHRGRRMSSATAIPGLDKRRVRGFMTLLDESAFESPGNHAPSYLNAAARPSALPKRHFCVMCGFFAPYTCTKCGLRYCCHKCNQQHLETRCNKTVH